MGKTFAKRRTKRRRRRKRGRGGKGTRERKRQERREAEGKGILPGLEGSEVVLQKAEKKGEGVQDEKDKKKRHRGPRGARSAKANRDVKRMVDYMVAKEVVTSKVEPFVDGDFHCNLCDEILMVHELAPKNTMDGWQHVMSVRSSVATTRPVNNFLIARPVIGMTCA